MQVGNKYTCDMSMLIILSEAENNEIPLYCQIHLPVTIHADQSADRPGRCPFGAA